MTKAASRGAARQKRHERIRLRVEGTAGRPRLAVFRSLNHIYAQVIDDAAGTTLAAASTLEPTPCKGRSRRKSRRPRSSAAWSPSGPAPPASSKVVFDRAGYRYHGRVKALADAAREAGLDF